MLEVANDDISNWKLLENMRLDEWLTAVGTWISKQKKRADAAEKQARKQKRSK